MYYVHDLFYEVERKWIDMLNRELCNLTKGEIMCWCGYADGMIV